MLPEASDPSRSPNWVAPTALISTNGLPAYPGAEVPSIVTGRTISGSCSGDGSIVPATPKSIVSAASVAFAASIAPRRVQVGPPASHAARVCASPSDSTTKVRARAYPAQFENSLVAPASRVAVAVTPCSTGVGSVATVSS